MTVAAAKKAVPATVDIKDMHQADVEMIFTHLKKAAVQYGFCSEYDNEVKKIVSKLNLKVAPEVYARPTLHSVSVRLEADLDMANFKGSVTNKLKAEVKAAVTKALREAVASALADKCDEFLFGDDDVSYIHVDIHNAYY